jgi:hypothetical protein
MADDTDYSDLISALGDISGNQEKLDALNQQMAAAKQLRQPMPQGHMAGNVYVAPNAMQSLGSAMSNLAANKSNASSIAQMQGLASQDQGARQRMMAEILRARQQQMASQQPQQQPQTNGPLSPNMQDPSIMPMLQQQ